MNDWYLDPPEEPEPPVCPKCKDFAEVDVLDDGTAVCTCEGCGHTWAIDLDPWSDYDPDLHCVDMEV